MDKTPPEQIPMLDEFVNRIKASNVQASFLFARMRTLGDRAFGPQPETAVSEKLDIDPACAVDRVFLALNELDILLARLESTQNRIDGLA